MRTLWLVGVLALLLVVGVLFWDNVTELLGKSSTLAKSFLDWSENAAKRAGSVSLLGVAIPLGPIVIMGSYVVACVFMLPLFGFHGVSGYLYGTIPGALLVTASQTIGACCSFLIARFLAHKYLSAYLLRKYGKKYTAIDDAISQDSFKVVLMMRLSPVIPFGLTNYVAGCAKVPIGKFAAATWLGLCPGTTFYVFMGALARTALSAEEIEAQAGWKMYLIGFGLCSTVYLLYLMSKKATAVLADAGFRDD